MTASRALSSLVVFNVLGRRIFFDFAQIFVALFHPLLQADLLILQSVSQFVSHDRLLLFHGDPIEQVHRFRLRIVVTCHFFLQKRNEESFEIEITREQAKFLQNEFGAAQTLRILVVHVFRKVGLDFSAAGQLAFYFPLNGQAGLFTVELHDFVDGMEQLLGLAGSDLDFAISAARFAEARASSAPARRGRPETAQAGLAQHGLANSALTPATARSPLPVQPEKATAESPRGALQLYSLRLSLYVPYTFRHECDQTRQSVDFDRPRP